MPIDEGSENFAVFIVFLAVYGSILLFGLVMCTAFAIALFRGRKVLNQWPFFRIVRNLIILDAIFLVSQVIFFICCCGKPYLTKTVSTFPDMVRDCLGRNKSFTIGNTTSEVETWLNSIPLYISMQLVDFLPNKGLVYFSLLMTINRAAVFVYPSWRRIFDRGTIVIPIFFCWIFVLALCYLSLMVTPIQLFNSESFRFEDYGRPLVEAPAVQIILRFLDSVIPFVIAGFYVRVYYAIRASRHTMVVENPNEPPPTPCPFSYVIHIERAREVERARSRLREVEDRRMLTQSLVIAAFLGLHNLAMLAGGVLKRGAWTQLLIGMVQLILSVLNHSVHSTLFILTNSTIRSFLPVKLNWRRGGVQPIPATTTDQLCH